MKEKKRKGKGEMEMEKRKRKRKRKRRKRERERERGGIRADRGADRDCTRTRVGRAWRGGRWFVTRGTGKREGRNRDWTSGCSEQGRLPKY